MSSENICKNTYNITTVYYKGITFFNIHTYTTISGMPLPKCADMPEIVQYLPTKLINYKSECAVPNKYS